MAWNNIKAIEKANERELSLGLAAGGASWHGSFDDTRHIHVGGLPFSLTEGDLLSVFEQYGQIVEMNLVRDKDTGKSKGYAFLGYQLPKSTVLAVQNFNGIKLGGRTILVDHVKNYRAPKDEDGNHVDKTVPARAVEGVEPAGEPAGEPTERMVNPSRAIREIVHYLPSAAKRPDAAGTTDQVRSARIHQRLMERRARERDGEEQGDRSTEGKRTRRPDRSPVRTGSRDSPPRASQAPAPAPDEVRYAELELPGSSLQKRDKKKAKKQKRDRSDRPEKDDREGKKSRKRDRDEGRENGDRDHKRDKRDRKERKHRRPRDERNTSTEKARSP